MAIEQEKEAWAAIQETRAALGLAPDYKDPLDIPKELENQQSTVQSAVSEIASSLAQVGIPFDPKDAEQAKAFDDFLRPDGDKSAGEGLEKVVEQAPAVRVARAAVARAQKQLDNARLQLSWTEVRSEIAGYVQDRQAHPGNRVEPGQTLLSIRPTLRLDRRQLQGDADRRHPDRHARGPLCRCLPAPGLPGPGGGLQPRNGPVGVAAAARERHGQLREGHPAPAGADRADRAQPGRHAAVRRPVGRAARPDQGTADRARCRPAAAYLRTAPAPRRRRRAGRIAAEEPRRREEAGGHEPHPATATGAVPRSRPRSITGSSHSRSRWRRSWRCSTPRSPTSRCRTSPAGCRSAGARRPGC